ncbi:MAG: protein kinase, partial [Polyangiaceae bacterium]
MLEPAEVHREVPFGPFVLERRIAVGGSAEVFVARPKTGTSPAPRLVIKRLLPTALGEEEFESLEREADLHRRVQHPSVVHVFGAGMVREEPFLAMEYVDGVDAFRL